MGVGSGVIVGVGIVVGVGVGLFNKSRPKVCRGSRRKERVFVWRAMTRKIRTVPMAMTSIFFMILTIVAVFAIDKQHGTWLNTDQDCCIPLDC